MIKKIRVCGKCSFRLTITIICLLEGPVTVYKNGKIYTGREIRNRR